MNRLWTLAASASLCLAQTPLIDRSKLVDMSYPFDGKTIYWPTAKPFEWHKDAWGPSAAGFWYASATFTTSELGGTHLDSPLHFGQGQPGTAEIPVSRLVGPAKVIDISAACNRDRDYRLTAADVAAFEKAHGRIAAGDLVLIRTGWGRFWPDRKKYLGDDTPADASRLSFPGLSREAAMLLAERGVSGVGIDTASIDYGKSKDFICHQVLARAGIFNLENVANLDKVPATGAILFALPVKISGGTGGPVRIIALTP
ncbi:MAG: cyclase family protein [Bryobacterales bacterium]|nr:cyclase family protein [Bryobacterales bacterium]